VLVHCVGNKETVLYCVKRTPYTYAVRFTQYADLYDDLRPTRLADVTRVLGGGVPA